MRKINRPFNSPDECRVFQSLFKFCVKKEIDVGTVKELLWDINAGPELVSFIRVIGNLNKIIQLANTCTFIGDDIVKSNTPWRKELGQLIENSHLLEEECGPQLTRTAPKISEVKANHPMKGICLGRNAVYAMLWNRADVDELRVVLEARVEALADKSSAFENIEKELAAFDKEYCLLQWHIFVTHKESIRSNNTIQSYFEHKDSSSYYIFDRGTLNSACKDVRDLGNGNKWPNLRVIKAARKTELFFHILKDQGFSQGSTESLKTLATKIIGGEWSLRSGGGSSRKRGSRRKSTAFYVEYGNDTVISHGYPGGDHQGGGEPRVRVLKEWTEIEGWVESDLSFEEQANDEFEENLVNIDCKKRSLDRDQIMAAIGFANKRRVLNQHLAIHYNIMNVAEVAECMHTLSNAFRDTGNSEIYKKSALLGIMMYWTGNLMKRFAGFTVVHGDGFVSDDVEIAYFVKDKLWRIKVPIYKASFKATHKERALCREGGEFLFFPDVWNLGDWLKQFKGGDVKDALVTPYKPSEFKKYEKAIKDIFKPLNDHGYRVSSGRLSSDLLMRLISASDPVCGVLITGQEHPAATTERHYSAPSIKFLLEIYLSVAYPLLKAIHKERYDSDHQKRNFKSHSNLVEKAGLKGVGADRCPTVSSVKQLLDRAKNKVAQINNLSEFHKAYTVYTTILIGFATGYRAVRNIRLDASCRDSHSESAWISDKDGADGYHTRRILLVSELEKHLVYYEEYRKKLFATWEVNYPQVLCPIESESPYLFFVDSENGSLINVSSASIKESLAELGYPLPLNSNRRFLRTELIERGCPYDVTQAFMGHWSSGQEPHNPYSCLSPQRERKMLKKYLIPLLAEIGFSAVQPRLAVFSDG